MRVSATTLRTCFNDSQVTERALAGSLVESIKVHEDKLVAPGRCAALGLPAGSRSQMVVYEDALGFVALAHRYLRPDGALGAHGKPDPKSVLCCGALLRQEKGA